MALLLAVSLPGYGAVAEVTLSGTATETPVSGFKGSAFTVGDAGSAAKAVFGISSKERSDEPCLVTVHTEDVNDSAKDGASSKNLCGEKGATSSELSADFPDTSVNGKRVFVTGARVCMNNDKTRVKGFQLRGKKIDDGGNLVSLTQDTGSPEPAGGIENGSSTVTEPRGERTNCDDNAGWMKWVECPAGKVATAVVTHFEGGETPRSLKGIALQCRSLTHTMVPAAAKSVGKGRKMRRQRPGLR